jgi:hypothetical protein
VEVKIRISHRYAAVAATLLASATFVSTPAHAAPTWNPTGTVRPGVQTNNPSGQCTANFVFYDASNNVYIGQAAHCTSLGGPTDTNGCLTTSRPVDTNVTVGGAQYTGKMVYNSWVAMRAAGETNSVICAFNDLAIVKLDSRDYGRVDPTVPFWGGPQGMYTPISTTGMRVFSYGNSGLRLGIGALSPKAGVRTARAGNNGDGRFWSHDVYTATPGIPGDSGSAFLDPTGRALGVLSTLGADASNGVGDLSLELDYLRAHPGSYPALSGLQLANGLRPFSTPA